MQNIETGATTRLTNSEYAKLVQSMARSGVALDEVIDSDGNRTARVPEEVYVAQKRRSEARIAQLEKAKQRRRAKAKMANKSRATNRRSK